jgi:hypothetical protein
VPSGGGILPLRPRACRDESTKVGGAAATMEGPSPMLVRALREAIHVSKETCRTTIGGTDSAMRMVSPNSFGSYAGAAHRGLVTCHGEEAGKLETKSFTASGLTKITLPNGCTAETDTHIFAGADDGFDRA